MLDQYYNYSEEDEGSDGSSSEIPHKKQKVFGHISKVSRHSIEYAGGTSEMRNHLQVCEKNPHNKSPNKKQVVLQKKEIDEANEETDKAHVPVKVDLVNQEAIRRALAYMLIVDELPFKFLEGKGFEHLMSVAFPAFNKPSRATTFSDCYQFYIDEKMKAKARLKNARNRICLTIDTWTSVHGVNYICVTAHFIDNDWKLQKMVLNFSPVTCQEKMGECIHMCLVDWGIRHVFTITFDNSSWNDATFEYLNKYFCSRGEFPLGGKFAYIRCIVHIINLTVQDALNAVAGSINRVRALVTYLLQSPTRMNEFKKYDRSVGQKMLCLDIPTKWNTTYFMLETALRHERSFELYELYDDSFRADLGNEAVVVPTKLDWGNIRGLVPFLKHFYELTLKVSGSEYVTSDNFFNDISNTDGLIKAWADSDDDDLRNTASMVKENYARHWGDIEKINVLIFIGAVLDPRIKFEYVAFVLVKMYGDDNGPRIAKFTKDAMYELFEEYKKLYPLPSPSSLLPSLDNSKFAPGVDPANKILNMYKIEFKRHKIEMDGNDSKSELDRYFNEEEPEDDTPEFNILDWWKVKSSRFPILSKMACDVLAIPISTVSFESTFTTGGRVLDTFKSSLTPRILNALICTKDWFRAPSTPVNVEEKLELEEFENGKSFLLFFSPFH